MKRLLLGTVLLSPFWLSSPSIAYASGELTGDQIAQKVWDREDGDARVQTIDMVLENASGRQRKRTAVSLTTDTDNAALVAIFFTAPSAIEETAFLSHDFDDQSKTDLQWLYLPATSRTRSIPASDRGDAFMGTDFSYDDMKSNLKLALDEYRFEFLETRITPNGPRHIIKAMPTSSEVSQSLGYGGATATVNPTTWLFDEITFTDTSNKDLKTITVDAAEEIDGIWTATRVTSVNHQTGHKTIFAMTNVQYTSELPESYFEPGELEFGLPDTKLLQN